MPRSSRQPSVAAGGCGGLAAARNVSSPAGRPLIRQIAAAPLQRPGPDTEGEVHSVLLHRNARGAEQAPIDGLIRTRYTLDVCVVCGHERIHTPRTETNCPECGAGVRRSFALFRGLREER
ncbi:MAG: hypothetical protein WBP81_28390 [Solirubrobacteraceae bacterium]